jgi:ParB/RepB/Spo0J family partition protein
MSSIPDEPTVRTNTAPAASKKPSPALRMGEAGERRLLDVRTLKVRENPRKIYTTESVESLGRSIGQYGQVQDCLGRLDASGEPELIVGSRRRRALLWLLEQEPTRAEFSKIAVVIRDVPEEAIAAIQFIENDEREDLTAVEVADHIFTLKTTLGWSDDDIAQKLGWNQKRIVGIYLTIADAPPWLKMYAVPVSHEVPKLDKNGQIQRGTDGSRLTTTVKGAALGMTHLHELSRFHRDIEKFDKKSKATNIDYVAVAQAVTAKFAKKASLDEWSKGKLKTFLDEQRTKLTGVAPPAGEPASKPPLMTVGKTRINIDTTSLTQPLPKAKLMEMKPDLVEVLQKLGFKNIILGTD